MGVASLQEQVTDLLIQLDVAEVTLTAAQEILANAIEIMEDEEGLSDENWTVTEGLLHDAYLRIATHLETTHEFS